MYFIFSVSEDGDCSCECITKEKTIERLNEDYYGQPEIYDKIPWDLDMQSGPAGLIIIKGKIVVPKPIKTVESYNME